MTSQVAETSKHGLCVVSTEGESQFEAFQSIIAEIMKVTFNNSSIYEQLANIHSVRISSQKSRNHIFVKPDVGNGGTHYKFINNQGEEVDPYYFFQIPLSHGFCQMYAFFIATGNTYGLTELTTYDQNENEITPDVNMLNGFIHNNIIALYKTGDLILSDPHFKRRFTKELKNISKIDNYGIVSACNAQTFFNHSKQLLVKSVALYVKELVELIYGSKLPNHIVEKWYNSISYDMSVEDYISSIEWP